MELKASSSPMPCAHAGYTYTRLYVNTSNFTQYQKNIPYKNAIDVLCTITMLHRNFMLPQTTFAQWENVVRV